MEKRANYKISRHLRKIGFLLTTLFTQNIGFGAGPRPANEAYNPLAILLIVIIIALLIVISVLANMVSSMAKIYMDGLKKTAQKSTGVKLPVLALFCTLAVPALAQQEAVMAPEITNISGLSLSSFYMLITVIALEVILLLVLLYFLRVFIAVEKVKTAAVISQPLFSKSSFKKWWENFNKFKPVKEEAAIDLGHSYDGIRELDNRLPPWWLYGFYVSILVGCIYLWRYHVTHSAPSSIQEYEMAMEKAEREKALYLAKSAGSVDENTVKYLTEAAALEAGKKLYASNCAACHGPQGEGVVGPNLVDDYWLHGGSIQDIFKSIKYGWPEKGMKSWKDDFSPVQIAELSSYIKSLHGSNVLNPKEPQGEKYDDTQDMLVLPDSLQAAR